MGEVRPRDPSDSWEEVEAGLVVPGLEDGRVVQVEDSLVELEDGRELVEATHHRVNILEWVEAIHPRVSTQAEVSTQEEEEEVSTPEVEVLLLPRVSIPVEVEVLLPRVNIPVEEEVLPQARLPAPGLAVSP